MSEQARKLLIVEDDPGLLSQLKWCFEGYDVYTAENREQAIAELRRHEPTVILQDLGLPPKPEGVEEGLATLAETLRLAPHTKVIVVTGNGDQENALTAVAQGAYDFYEKPVDTDTLKLLVDRAFNISELEYENRRLLNKVNDSPLDGIVAASEGMLAVCRMIEKIAPTDVTTLLLGESGTGKELLARALHRLSPRVEENFVAINCAAIPESLLESELFGHEKGSFTGAIARRIGKFEEANGGTLLLDEISEMDVRLQAKLLRAIQEREIDRVGGGEPIKVDIRLIATSNRVLEDEVRKGTFREDLLFRLNVITIALPPLRERPLDIDMLTEHFLKKYAEVNGVPERPLSQAAYQKLHNHDWRGNVRELENTTHRAVLLAQGDEIGTDASILSNSISRDGDTATDSVPTDSSDNSTSGETPAPTRPLVGRKMSDVERDLIIDTVYHCLGNRTHAATILGISIRTLRNKLKQYSEDGVAVPMPNSFERAVL